MAGLAMKDGRKRHGAINLPPADLFEGEIELAWQAAIIDGEGTITITRQNRKNRPSPSFRPYVTVTNTDPNLIAPFQTMWGGGVYLVIDSRTEKNWSDSYTWYCQQSKVVPFLIAILPLLRGKRKQAELVLDFMKTSKAFERVHLGKGGWSNLLGSAPLSPEEIEHREKLKTAVQILNAKSKRGRYLRGGDARDTHRSVF